jgi:hypothetical protein
MSSRKATTSPPQATPALRPPHRAVASTCALGSAPPTIGWIQGIDLSPAPGFSAARLEPLRALAHQQICVQPQFPTRRFRTPVSAALPHDRPALLWRGLSHPSSFHAVVTTGEEETVSPLVLPPYRAPLLGGGAVSHPSDRGEDALRGWAGCSSRRIGWVGVAAPGVQGVVNQDDPLQRRLVVGLRLQGPLADGQQSRPERVGAQFVCGSAAWTIRSRPRSTTSRSRTPGAPNRSSSRSASCSSAARMPTSACRHRDWQHSLMSSCARKRRRWP